ncbi:MAG: elongation factor G [Acidobacteria bacterium]|nr:elongation factor G [Acidobacteriota bacterium]
MATFTTEALRTVALVGHGASGKTTLTEALLQKAGMIQTPGSVERGTTVSDFDPLEKQFLHSLYSSIVHLDYAGTRTHLIDTPGHPDFIGQAIGALDAVETVAVVVNAQSGIELVTRRMMEWAADRGLCRMIIINRIDAENVDLPGVVRALQDTFGKACLPINLPADGGARVIDCFANDTGEADFLSVTDVHRMVLEQIVEVDEAAMERYLEQGDVDPAALHAPLEKALREGHIIPICFVSARTGAGVRDLLEVFARHLPNPSEGNPPLFYKGEGETAREFRSEPDPKKHVLAHVFKVMSDPYVGRLGVFRVHQGTVTRDTQLFVSDGRKPFKVGHLFLLHGRDHVEVQEAVPGDIAAVARVEEVTFDAVLHDSHDEDHIHMRPLVFPRPMFGLAIEPRRRGDEQKISEVLHRIAAEDPTFQVEHDAATHETVIRGLGDLHVRSVLERMNAHFKVEVDTRPPRIPFRETIAARADGHARHRKQTGGAGQFGEVYLRVEPLDRGAGFEFLDHSKGGVIPNQFIPAIEKGVRQVIASGAVAGYPMQDIRVIVYDGKHHPVDSKEVAFVSAGRKAFLDALDKARPVVLEPIVSVDIVCPDAAMGDITGDISGKRGQITGTEATVPGMCAIRGLVPLSELNGYASRLKSVTGGQGSYSMSFAHYEPVPPTVQARLATEYKAARGQDVEVD